MTTTYRLLALVLATAALSTYGADAASNWKESCAKCHGEDGKGETKMGRKLSIADLTDAKVSTVDHDFRMLHANGKWIWLRARCEVVRQPGEPVE